jgi:alanyl-tRNA synthetase
VEGYVDSVVGRWAGTTPSCTPVATTSFAVIRAEEERFNQTLDNGLARFEQIVQGLAGDTIPGADAFMLYDTFGFPLDLTRVMAEEKNLRVDEAGFAAEMEAQRARAREAGRFRYDAADYDWRELHPDYDPRSLWATACTRLLPRCSSGRRAARGA